MWMFHIWLAECLLLETSLEWREDVTADSGTADSIRPKRARQRQRDSRWKLIPLEKNLVWGLSFPTWKRSGSCWHGPEPSDLRSGLWYRTLAKESTPSVVTRTRKSCVSQGKDIELEHWFSVKVRVSNWFQKMLFSPWTLFKTLFLIFRLPKTWTGCMELFSVCYLLSFLCVSGLIAVDSDHLLQVVEADVFPSQPIREWRRPSVKT